MVIRFFFIICGLCFNAAAMHGANNPDQDVSISAVIDPYKAFEKHPLQGTITITHEADVPVDAASFRLGDKPLEVEHVKDVRISSKLIISIYNFQLPGQPKGVYTLPRISAKIGGESYYSLATSYEVTGAAATPNVNVSTGASDAVLTLRASVDGPLPLYPGQRARLVYRFYFKGDVELTSESLPLLDPKGFVRIGEKQITEFQQGGFNVQEIAQDVQTVEP